MLNIEQRAHEIALAAMIADSINMANDARITHSPLSLDYYQMYLAKYREVLARLKSENP